MKALLILLVFLRMLQADDSVVKVVYDLTAGDLPTFERKVLSGIVANKAHYEGSFKELEVVVVIHGGAYKFFVKDTKHPLLSKEKELREAHATLSKRIASMSETYNVKFLMCGVGMNKHKLNKEDVYEFVEVVPNSTIGLIDKQNEGFAYIPI